MESKTSLIKRLTSITGKVWLSVGIAFLGYFIATMITYFANSDLTNNTEIMINSDLPLSFTSVDMVNSYKKQIESFQNGILLGEEDSVNEGAKIGKTITAHLNEMIALTEKYKKDPSVLKKLKSEYELYISSAVDVYRKMAGGDETMGSKVKELGTVQTTLLKKFEKSSAELIDTLKKNMAVQGATTRSNTNFLIVLFFMVILASVIVILLISNKMIARPLKKILSNVEELSEGDADLTQRVEVYTKDELYDLSLFVNKFIHRLQKLMIQIKKNAETVSMASNELSTSSEELSATSEEQSSQAQSVKVSLDELARTSNEIEELVTRTRETVQKSSKLTRDGGKIIQQSIDSLSTIRKHSDNLSNIIGNLGESTSKIGSILDVINDVADQTNLLALNAAIEAARAGDAGRGFAVVADEVRKLAERTGGATEEITSIISGLQNESDMAVSAMAETVEEVTNSTKLGEQSLGILDEIVSSSDEIEHSTINIASAITQENATIENINHSVSEIATGAEESSRSINEVSRIAENLTAEADHLTEQVQEFKTK